jgi:hypothetical protein
VLSQVVVTLYSAQAGCTVMSSIEDEIRKRLLEALDIMPGVIRSGLLETKNSSATNTLRWTELAVRLHRGPVDRPLTDLDRRNADEARQILREAVPLLQKILIKHSSERMRRRAEQYLRVIAIEVDAKTLTVDGGR